MTRKEKERVAQLEHRIKVLKEELTATKHLNESMESIYDQKVLERNMYISDLQKEIITLKRQYSLAQSHITMLSTRTPA